jgi:hypothetical protein
MRFEKNAVCVRVQKTNDCGGYSIGFPLLVILQQGHRVQHDLYQPIGELVSGMEQEDLIGRVLDGRYRRFMVGNHICDNGLQRDELFVKYREVTYSAMQGKPLKLLH